MATRRRAPSTAGAASATLFPVGDREAWQRRRQLWHRASSPSWQPSSSLRSGARESFGRQRHGRRERCPCTWNQDTPRQWWILYWCQIRWKWPGIPTMRVASIRGRWCERLPRPTGMPCNVELRRLLKMHASWAPHAVTVPQSWCWTDVRAQLAVAILRCRWRRLPKQHEFSRVGQLLQWLRQIERGQLPKRSARETKPGCNIGHALLAGRPMCREDWHRRSTIVGDQRGLADSCALGIWC